jgi:hypothetical protein
MKDLVISSLWEVPTCPLIASLRETEESRTFYTGAFWRLEKEINALESRYTTCRI